ncbi:MAG: methyltransferase domain-containing protein [Vulcanimicrobiaceae bacterium]|jgi:2-polyprenyl-3-methyl-5-hydroxy-6-metoxy-1,4-benzoquinol methylase
MLSRQDVLPSLSCDRLSEAQRARLDLWYRRSRDILARFADLQAEPALQYSLYDSYQEFKKLETLIKWARDLTSRSGKRIRVLDMASSIGNISVPLAKIGCEVHAVEVNKESIACLRALSPDVIIHETSLLNLQRADLGADFDLIIAADVLEHLAKPQDVIQDAYDLLNNGGTFAVAIPNGYGPFELLLDIPVTTVKRLLRRIDNEYDFHVQFFTLERFRRLTSAFEMTSVENFSFLGFYPQINGSRLAKLDFEFSLRLPHAVASRWLIRLEKLQSAGALRNG